MAKTLLNLRVSQEERDRFREASRQWAERLDLSRPESRLSDWTRAMLSAAADEELKPSRKAQKKREE
jgi:hypothetical protein